MISTCFRLALGRWIVVAEGGYGVQFIDQVTDRKDVNEEISSRNEKSSPRPSNIRRTENRWILGITLFLAGTIFLFQNLTGWRIEKWWSLLLLVPASASFVTAWRRAHMNGTPQRWEILRPVAMGLFFLGILVVLLFNLPGQSFFAILFMIAGGVVLIGFFFKSERPS